MPRTTRALAPLALAALMLASAPSLAQPDPGRRGNQVVQSEGGSTVSIQFPGGSMTQFVAALQSGVRGPLNIVLRDKAGELSVPPMDLKMVSVHTALSLAIPTPRNEERDNSDGTRTQFTRALQQIGGNDHASAPVYIIEAKEFTYDPKPLGGASRNAAPRIEVYSLEKAVETDADVQKLLAAIDTALALGEGDRAAEVKYHPDTSLVIVRGTPDQVHTIERVIDRYRDTSATRENERYEQAIRLSELNAELIERRAELQRAEAELDVAVQELAETEKLAARDMMSSRDLLQARTRLRMQEADIDVARARYHAAEEKMAMFSASVDRPASESKTYGLPSTRMQDRVSSVLSAIDSISPHIRSVRSVSSGDGQNAAVEVTADEEGHEVVARVIGAITGRG